MINKIKTLSIEQLQRKDKAWKKYEKIRDLAWQEYYKKCEEINKEEIK